MDRIPSHQTTFAIDTNKNLFTSLLRRIKMTKTLTVFSAVALIAGSANAASIFSENFEGWDGTTDLAGSFPAGSFTNTTWANSAFTLDIGGNLLRPNPTSSPWLNPIPAALGTTFAVIHSDSTATADVGVNFADNTIYTLTFTQFKRDDIADESPECKKLATAAIKKRLGTKKAHQLGAIVKEVV